MIAGDWDSLVAASQAGTFLGSAPDPGRVDVILTAETIYAQPQIEKLVRLIHQLLRRQISNGNDGGGSTNPNTPFALVAAKRYYFGTNGGTLSFEQALSKMPLVHVEDCGHSERQILALVSTSVMQVEDGQSNIREVLRVQWKEVRR